MPYPSSGLLLAGGIGEGLSQGVDSFLKTRGLLQEEADKKTQREHQKQQLGLLAAKANMQANPETGGFDLTDFGRQQQQATTAKEAAELGHVKAQTNKENAIADFTRTTKGTQVRTKEDDAFEAALAKNKNYTTAQKMTTDADTLVNHIKEAVNNPATNALLQTELGVFASGGQRLHSQTFKATTNPDQSAYGRLLNATSRISTGKMPPELAQQLIEHVENARDSNADVLQKMTAESAEKFKKIHGRYPSTFSPEDAQPRRKMSDEQRALMIEMLQKGGAPNGLLQAK